MSVKNELELYDYKNTKDLHLSPAENALVALDLKFMKLFLLAKSQWPCQKDKCISVRLHESDVENTFNEIMDISQKKTTQNFSLPRTLKDSSLLTLQFKRDLNLKGVHRHAFVDPKKTSCSIDTLQKAKQSALYKCQSKS